MNKKILICGKGYSFKYFEKFKKNYTILISYNHIKNNNVFNYNFFSKSKEELCDPDDKKVILESRLNKFLNTDPIAIGSTTFGLYPLLNFISVKYPNSQVHLVGFDNRYIYEENVNQIIKLDLQSFINIESQRVLNNKLENLFDNIKISFIGFDILSGIDAKTNSVIKFDSINNVEVVAEITTNHFGDTDRLKELIIASKRAGADSVKFQMRDVMSFYKSEKLEEPYDSPFGKTFRDYRIALELTNSQIRLIEKYCKQLDIKYFFSALDFKSYKKLKVLEPYRIKLPSTISMNRDFISKVFLDFNGEIVVSTGMSDESYLNFILNQKSNYSKLYLLHCISSYPTNIFNLNLEMIKRYSSFSKKIIPGYSSHDIGYEGSMFSVFAGARMIEKHIKLGNTKFAHFDETALDVNLEFGEFIKMIRKAEIINGSSKKKILKGEDHKY